MSFMFLLFKISLPSNPVNLVILSQFRHSVIPSKIPPKNGVDSGGGFGKLSNPQL
jgi:hypothetical protein